jgi:hypothetical protein
MNELNSFTLRRIIKRALEEDIGSGDVTTEAICEPDQMGRAVIRTKEPCVIAGVVVAQLVFETLDGQIEFTPRVRDGERLSAHQTVAEISGRLRAILMGERTALNFLQRLSGDRDDDRALRRSRPRFFCQNFGHAQDCAGVENLRQIRRQGRRGTEPPTRAFRRRVN